MLQSKGGQHAEFLIWHEAKIEALVVNHPLIHSWFWQQDPILLTPVGDYFSIELDTSNNDSRYQFHNPFIGRKSDIEYLESFLKNNKYNILAIVVDGGYGKTRLCIEFFEKIVSQSNFWYPVLIS